MRIAPAREQDAAALVALVRSAYRGDESRVGWTTEADLLTDDRIDLPEMQAKLRRPYAVVLAACTDDGALVGCCEVVRTSPALGYFGMFAVRPTLQSAGLGRRLLEAAEAFAVEHWAVADMEMTVIAQRTELIAWYARRGYTPTGEVRPFPYDALAEGQALRDDLVFAVLRKALSSVRPLGPRRV